jgi:hypothetical protein
MKTRLQNQLYEYMDLMVWIFVELFCIINMILYDDVITTLID